MLHKHIEQIIFILILFVPFSEKLRQSRVFQHMNITCNRERSLTREGGARSHALLIYLHFNMHFFSLEVMSVLVLSIILMCLLLWESKFL